jgi:hypothetical protein
MKKPQDLLGNCKNRDGYGASSRIDELRKEIGELNDKIDKLYDNIREVE